MPSFIKVAKLSELPEGSGKLVEVGGKQIALFNAGGKLFAIDNSCKHRGGPLAEGELDGTTITCPWHGWEYDLATGQSFMGPGRGAMAALSYEVTVQPGSELAAPRADGRIPGPYVAETIPVSVRWHLAHPPADPDQDFSPDDRALAAAG